MAFVKEAYGRSQHGTTTIQVLGTYVAIALTSLLTIKALIHPSFLLEFANFDLEDRLDAGMWCATLAPNSDQTSYIPQGL